MIVCIFKFMKETEVCHIIQFNLELYACIFDKYCVKTYFVSKDILQGWSDSWWIISKLRTTKQTLQRRPGQESIVGIFPSRREDTEMESRWCDEDRYIQLVGRQGSSTIFRLPRDPRRPEEPQCSLHLSSSGHFTLSLNQTRGGGWWDSQVLAKIVGTSR